MIVVRMTTTNELDPRGLFCPEPVFKTSVELQKIESGETLIVKTDDPASKNDIETFCHRHNYELKEIKELEDGEFEFTIYKNK